MDYPRGCLEVLEVIEKVVGWNGIGSYFLQGLGNLRKVLRLLLLWGRTLLFVGAVRRVVGKGKGSKCNNWAGFVTFRCKL